MAEDRRKRRGVRRKSAGVASVKTVERAERIQEALSLRKQGYSFFEIASHMGVSQAAAFRYVDDGIKSLQREGAAEVLEMELARLDELQSAIYANAVTGSDHAAFDRVLAVMDRRAKMLGLNAPERREISGADGGPIEMVSFAAETVRAKIDAMAKRLGGKKAAAEDQAPA